MQELIDLPFNEEATIQFSSNDETYDYKYQKTTFKKNFQAPINKKLSDQEILEILNPVLTVKTTKIQTVCRHFKEGVCKLGENCPYIHE
ncbi:Zinc finger C-x8-C-x5-C-x3-H type domain-containing protein [Spironucleus salmonicida]|uniref:Zinc finger C-x8-C-x5-C-x3-H type domain-containing protein n=1 Tax=Spironucleus salmonicida TaxID=348837 RepID=V6LRA3_9EUKA|nr:Zinc finger C-x8-C-x5-C-x3-H type domain-containing protein [Spironucleus salmonicida]|eukprot:EST47135.1 Zinc finger C-x8-C-x5-C-x3-H type domain-containing protein [Spironucleus salmonicida]